jgi:hypothetical protein
MKIGQGEATRIQGFGLDDRWAILPSLDVHLFPWGWSVQFAFIHWGVDISHDYKPKKCGYMGNVNGPGCDPDTR